MDMRHAPPDTFRGYLEEIPDELLELVTEDYVWLAGSLFPQSLFPQAPQGIEFRRRRECCREECSRRGTPQLFRMAEETIDPRAA
jgi:hypothetical protein